MSNKRRNESISSSDNFSEPTEFDRSFRISTDASLTTFDSSCFKSTEATYHTDTDGSELRKIIQSDSFLQNASTADSIQSNKSRAFSTILAAGTAKGSSLNTSIETLNSTILDGAMDSDVSFYSPNELSENISYSTQNLLNKRLESDDEFKDCETSPSASTLRRDSTLSTQYKSFGNVFFPTTTSENNNNIFLSNKSSNSQICKTPDTGVTLEESSSSNKYSIFARQVQHLTTILEESTSVNNTKSNRISGKMLLSIVEKLDDGTLLVENKDFNNSVKNLADILNRTQKEITINEVSEIILHILRTRYNYSDSTNSSESLCSFENISKLSGMSGENSGKELDSIMRELGILRMFDKKIENESSPEWPSSVKSATSNSLRKKILVSTVNQKLNSSERRKEYFPHWPYAPESNKENLNLPSLCFKGTRTISPTKKRVSFSPKIHKTSSVSKVLANTQKKKYQKTPLIWKSKLNSEKNSFFVNTTQDSFLYWDKTFNREFDNVQSKLRRSNSVPNIRTEESIISEAFKTLNCHHNQTKQCISRYKMSDKLINRTRRSKSTDNCYFPEITNKTREIYFPSTSGIKRLSPNQQKTRIHTPEKCVASNDNSPKKAHYKVPSKISFLNNSQKKKYPKTPIVKKSRQSLRKKNSTENAHEDSFLFWERKCNREYENSRPNLRRSNSFSDIIAEESTTFEVSKTNNCNDNQNTQNISRLDDKKGKFHFRRRRSKSVENCNRKINLPSTSAIAKTISSNNQQTGIPLPKIFVNSSINDICKSQTEKKVNYKTPSKISCLPNVSRKSMSRKSTGVDITHIPAVSQLRRIFSPAKGALITPVDIPRIQITKSSPERSINATPSPLVHLRRQKTPNSQEQALHKKPWRP